MVVVVGGVCGGSGWVGGVGEEVVGKWGGGGGNLCRLEFYIGIGTIHIS